MEWFLVFDKGRKKISLVTFDFLKFSKQLTESLPASEVQPSRQESCVEIFKNLQRKLIGLFSSRY
jgi:hypothetical protein